MFGAVPLLIVPFVLYNLGLLGIFGSGDDPWASEMFSFGMMSGGVFSMTLGDLMVLIALIFALRRNGEIDAHHECLDHGSSSVDAASSSHSWSSFCW